MSSCVPHLLGNADGLGWVLVRKRARKGKKKEEVSTKVLSGTSISVFSSSLFKPPQLQAAMVGARSASTEGTFKGAVSECGSGVSVPQPRGAHATAGLALHDLEGSVLVSNGALVQRECVSRRRLQDGIEDVRSGRASTAGVELVHATTGESKGITGSLERYVSESSLSNSVI